MNCPYCDSKMKKGYILSPYALAKWYAENEKPRWNPLRNSGTRLSKNNVLRVQKIVSYYCERCKKIVIDIPSE